MVNYLFSWYSSSGRWSPTSTVSTRPAPTMATRTCSSSASMYTSMRLQVRSFALHEQFRRWVPNVVETIGMFCLSNIFPQLDWVFWLLWRTSKLICPGLIIHIIMFQNVNISFPDWLWQNKFYGDEVNLLCITLFVSCRRQIRAPCHTGGPGTWYHGLSQIRTVWTNLSPRQFHLWPKWSRKQLGERSLHRGRRARGLGSWCGSQRGRGLRLSAGLPAHTLTRGRYRSWYGHPDDQQNSRRVSGQDHEHVLCRAFSQGNAPVFMLVYHYGNAQKWYECTKKHHAGIVQAIHFRL